MPVKRTSGKAKTKQMFGHLHQTSNNVAGGTLRACSAHDQQTHPMQMRAMREYAANRGWTVAMHVKEVESRAKEQGQRQHLIDAARPREIACAEDMARLGSAQSADSGASGPWVAETNRFEVSACGKSCPTFEDNYKWSHCLWTEFPKRKLSTVWLMKSAVFFFDSFESLGFKRAFSCA